MSLTSPLFSRRLLNLVSRLWLPLPHTPPLPSSSTSPRSSPPRLPRKFPLHASTFSPLKSPPPFPPKSPSQLPSESQGSQQTLADPRPNTPHPSPPPSPLPSPFLTHPLSPSPPPELPKKSKTDRSIWLSRLLTVTPRASHTIYVPSRGKYYCCPCYAPASKRPSVDDDCTPWTDLFLILFVLALMMWLLMK